MQSKAKPRQPAFSDRCYDAVVSLPDKIRFRLTDMGLDHTVQSSIPSGFTMATQVSDRLRDALERLDSAIDRLDARIDAHLNAPQVPAPANPVIPAVVERLDRIIGRIEGALAQ